MANLTIAVDDDLLQKARIRALEQGSSVNALLREYLEGFVDHGLAQRHAIRALGEMADQSQSGSGSAGRQWTREKLYDRGSAR